MWRRSPTVARSTCTGQRCLRARQWAASVRCAVCVNSRRHGSRTSARCVVCLTSRRHGSRRGAPGIAGRDAHLRYARSAALRSPQPFGRQSAMQSKLADAAVARICSPHGAGER